MSKKLVANGNHTLVELAEPEIDETKRGLLLDSSALNPSLHYGKVLSTGNLCSTIHTDVFVYFNKMNAFKLSHNGKEYYITEDKDILVYISDEQDEPENTRNSEEILESED